MNKELAFSSVENCLRWTENVMLTFDRGYWGVYERIRIDRNERVCHCRPDTSSELAKTLFLYEKESGKTDRKDIYENQIEWLRRVQNENGSFCFAFADGTPAYYVIRTRFPNDNGKILLNLLALYRETGDKRTLDMAVRLADYWADNQTERGNYFSETEKQFMCKSFLGPCFGLWMAAGMVDCWKITGNERYLSSAKKNFAYMQRLIVNGRMQTSMEQTQDPDEFWRPVSSENAMALYAFAHAWRSYPDPAWKAACENILPFFLGLVDEKTGAVRNCDASSMDASQNNDPDLCDFVYTQGFALHAFLELYEAFGDGAMLARAEKLADWIVSVQCRGESPKWDGSWRGAISLSTGKWAGRCNQNNAILDEGGEFSAYTGWSAYPICMGLLRLVRCLENEKLKK